jgi:hypothetical protein
MPASVDIGDLELPGLADTESGTVQGCQQSAMALRARGLQQSLDFVAAEDRRQFSLALRSSVWV